MAGESGPIPAPNSVTISAGATGASSRLPKLTTGNGGCATTPVKSILAMKPSSQGSDCLEDGELMTPHVAGKRESAMGVPAMGKLFERVEPATYIAPPVVTATALAES